ncbi:MAG TPA: hypothetical protein VKR58_06050 [Aquella sp.]|nr:hypothetical protein [Aquella sp.]
MTKKELQEAYQMALDCIEEQQRQISLKDITIENLERELEEVEDKYFNAYTLVDNCHKPEF